MALLIRSLSTILRTKIKSEYIWDHIIKHEPYHMYKYKAAVKFLIENQFEDIDECLYFPFTSFKSCPTAILKNTITDSFAFIKEKVMMNDVNLYNAVLKSYIINSIDFDIDKLLQEMRDKEIKFNQETFSLLIRYYCNLGQMDSVENLISEISPIDKDISYNDKLSMIKGYIIGGQIDKSMKYMSENCLDENDSGVYSSLMFGYSSVGQFDTVISIIEKIEQNNVKISLQIYLQIYQRLAQKNAQDFYLDRILNTCQIIRLGGILSLIFQLNRAELFDYSLKLIEKYFNEFSESITPEIIRSFNSKNCPIEIYKQTITILLKFKYVPVYNNLFENMNFNDAISFANNLTNEINYEVVALSLINRSIMDKSIDNIKKSLEFAMDKLDMQCFNTILIVDYFPLMLANRIVTNYQKLIYLFPSFSNFIIPLLLMYSLMNKQFDKFDWLKSNFKYRKIYLFIRRPAIANLIVSNYETSEDIHKFAKKLTTVFEKKFVEALLIDIIIIKIIESSNNDNIDGINNAINWAKNLNISLTSPIHKDYLISHASNYQQMFQVLFDQKAMNNSSMETTNQNIINQE